MTKHKEGLKKNLDHKALVETRYIAVKAMVEKGMSIDKACKKCGFHGSYFYKNFTKDQRKILNEINARINKGFNTYEVGNSLESRKDLFQDEDEMF